MASAKVRPRVYAPTAEAATTIKYEDAVSEGKKVCASIERSQMRLGEIADKIEKRYGDNTLARFAREIGIAPCTAERYRSVYRSWATNSAAPPDLPWGVARELQAHPDRAKLVKKNPQMSTRDARLLMKQHRNKQPDATPVRWQEVEARRWFRGLVTRANQAIRDIHLADGKRQSPLDDADAATIQQLRQVLREQVEHGLLKTLRRGAENWLKLADHLERLLQSDAPTKRVQQ